MRKALRRMYVSILMLSLSIIAIGFTTYAWVGIASNSTFDNFTINLKPNNTDDSEYGIQLSLTGKKGEFSDSIDPIDLKRQLLENCGVDTSRLTASGVEIEFNKLRLDQCTVSRNSTYNNAFNKFFNMGDGVDHPTETNKYFWFDLYISLYRKDGEIDLGDQNLNVYLRQVENDEGKLDILESEVYSTNVLNRISYPNSNPVGRNILGNGINFGQEIYGNVSVKTANSARIALQKFSSRLIGDTSWNYVDIKDLTIYRTGSEFPTYDSINNVYDFGAVLEKDYNFAYNYHVSLMNYNFDYMEPFVKFSDVLNRGDILYKDDGIVNHIVKETDEVTTNKMAHFRVYFWFEGWDADCFDVIDNHKVSINLAFSTKSPND